MMEPLHKIVQWLAIAPDAVRRGLYTGIVEKRWPLQHLDVLRPWPICHDIVAHALIQQWLTIPLSFSSSRELVIGYHAGIESSNVEWDTTERLQLFERLRHRFVLPILVDGGLQSVDVYTSPDAARLFKELCWFSNPWTCSIGKRISFSAPMLHRKSAHNNTPSTTGSLMDKKTGQSTP